MRKTRAAVSVLGGGDSPACARPAVSNREAAELLVRRGLVHADAIDWHRLFILDGQAKLHQPQSVLARSSGDAP